VTGNDTTLTAAIQHRMNGDDGAILENANLVGRAVHFNRSTACAVRHAVKIAVDRDHAIARDASLEPRHGVEWPGGQWLKRRALFGEMLSHNPLGRGVGAHIGNLVKPLTELRIEIVEIAKAPAEEEVLTDVAEGAVDLALRFGPIRLAGLRKTLYYRLIRVIWR
jgi:hypothetical protein